MRRSPWWWLFEICVFGVFLDAMLSSGVPVASAVVVISMVYVMYWVGMYLLWRQRMKSLSVEIDDTAVTGPSTTTFGRPVRIPLDAIDMERTLARPWIDKLCGYWRIYSKDGTTVIGLSSGKLGSDVVRSVFEDLRRAVPVRSVRARA